MEAGKAAAQLIAHDTEAPHNTKTVCTELQTLSAFMAIQASRAARRPARTDWTAERLQQFSAELSRASRRVCEVYRRGLRGARDGEGIRRPDIASDYGRAWLCGARGDAELGSWLVLSTCYDDTYDGWVIAAARRSEALGGGHSIECWTLDPAQTVDPDAVVWHVLAPVAWECLIVGLTDREARMVLYQCARFVASGAVSPVLADVWQHLIVGIAAREGRAATPVDGKVH